MIKYIFKIRKQTENQHTIIKHMIKITHVKITNYIDDMKNNANKCSNACWIIGVPRNLQLNTTDAPSTSVGGQGAVN